jgi:hypothetical protein
MSIALPSGSFLERVQANQDGLTAAYAVGPLSNNYGHDSTAPTS